MAWKKLTALTEETSPGLSDILYMVKNPSTTPLDRKVTFQSFKNLISPAGRRSLTLSGTLVLTDTDLNEQFLNPDGADRIVTLPAGATDNHYFNIHNTGSSMYNLVVQTSGGVTVGLVTMKQGKTFRSDASTWYCEGGQYKTIWLPAGVIKPRLNSGCNDVATYETATNYQNFDYILFPDSGVSNAVATFLLPPDYIASSVLYAKLFWGFPATATGTDTYWAFKAYGYSHDVALEQAFSSTRYLTATGVTTSNKMFISALTSSITINGTATPGCYINFQLQRVPGNANDTAAQDVRLYGVLLYYATGRV